jgi:anti-anti-sigma factor
MDSVFFPISQDILERTNPVFNTAKMTLFQLSAAGDKDAIEIVDKLGLTLEGTQGDATAEELLASLIILETRYRTMGLLAEKTPFETKVDLPCGYTPRAIEFARKGIKFVGLDLPAAIAEGKNVITSLIPEDKRDLVRFEGIDATNYDSLKKVLDDVTGEVCITTEGLLMYLTDSETGELCDNIRRILIQHGGCWLMADAESALQYVLTAKAIYGDRFMEIMLKAKKQAENKSDVDVSSRTMVIDPQNPEESIKSAMEFLAKHGLKAERMIISDYAPEIENLKKTTPQQAEEVKEAMKKFAYWKITVIDGMKLDTKEARAENFDLKAEFAWDGLKLHLCGRLDTLSAPGLLAFYEKTVGLYTIEEAVVDCSQLEYISSAGLRVLLIMQKKCKRGVTLININEEVREILEQTGFDSLLNIAE